MKRSEKYKSIKRYKKKCRRVLFFTLILTITGIIAADYSVNNLMTNNKKVKVISFGNENSKLEISILNQKFSSNSEFIIKLAKQLKHVLN